MEGTKLGARVLPCRHQGLGCPKALHGEGAGGDKPPIPRASWGSGTGVLASTHHQDVGIGLRRSRPCCGEWVWRGSQRLS